MPWAGLLVSLSSYTKQWSVLRFPCFREVGFSCFMSIQFVFSVCPLLVICVNQFNWQFSVVRAWLPEKTVRSDRRPSSQCWWVYQLSSRISQETDEDLIWTITRGMLPWYIFKSRFCKNGERACKLPALPSVNSYHGSKLMRGGRLRNRPVDRDHTVDRVSCWSIPRVACEVLSDYSTSRALRILR